MILFFSSFLSFFLPFIFLHILDHILLFQSFKKISSGRIIELKFKNVQELYFNIFFFFFGYNYYNRVSTEISQIRNRVEGWLSLVICPERNSRFRERGRALGCGSRHSYPND